MTNFDVSDRAAIVGVGHSPYGRRLMRSPIELAADAIANALDDSGLTRDELDGLIVSFGSPIGADGDTLGQLLGLRLRTYHQTWSHGRFTASCVIWAAMMVNAGLCDAVACLASVMFLGGWRGPNNIGPQWLQELEPLFWFVLRVFVFLFVYIWVRGTLPRFRYDQLMAFGWKFLLPLALVNLIATAIAVAW